MTLITKINIRKVILFSFLLLLISAISLAAQVDPLIYKGDRSKRATNIHDGNSIRTNFYNYGLIGRNIDEEFGGEWPKNSGHEAVGDVSINVGAEVRARVDTAKVEEKLINDGFDPQAPTFQAVLDSAVKSYSIQQMVTVSDGPRTQNEYSPDGETFWGWEPLPDFMSNDTSLVAMSQMPISWPDSWPDKFDQGGWSGEWNGYFGKGVTSADQESYWRMDDYNDTEFITNLYQYYPSPVSDLSRGGLGLQAGGRGLQWANAQAKDAIFWIYDIANISEKNLDKTGFSILMGGIIGENSTNDNAKFYRFEKDRNGEKLNMAVSYDEPFDDQWFAWVGYKFLESPGNATDGIDNDADSPNADSYDQIDSSSTMFDPLVINTGDNIIVIGNMTDTTFDIGNGTENVLYIRYNGSFDRTKITMPDKPLVIQSGTLNELFFVRPGDFVIETINDLMDNNLNGLIDENGPAHHGFAYKNYDTGLGVNDPMIDEARDDGIDNNQNWNIDLDDVGLDGVPGTGDAGEGDGVPSPGEPNFDALDIQEADQIGLTAFYFFEPFNRLVQRDDKGMWEKMKPGTFENTKQNVDGDFLFSASYFPMLSQRTERISLVLLYATTEEGLINKAATVQQIYNLNYNFAQAPLTPNADSSPYSQRAVIYWDNVAETDSYDKLFGNAVPGHPELGYDFEGYRIYRSTSPEFTPQITDAFGEPQFIKPIVIYDLADSISGLSENGISGVHFNLGDDSGLANSYEDVNLINGLTYYYVVNSFDYGYVSKLHAIYPELDQFNDIAPTESSFSIKLLPSGEVVTGPNVVTVIPSNAAVGFKEPEGTDDLVHNGAATGSVDMNLIDPFELDVDSVLYSISFEDTVTLAMTYTNSSGVTGRDTLTKAYAYNVSKTLPDHLGGFNTTPDTVFKEWPLDKTRVIIDGFEVVLEEDPNIRFVSSESGTIDADGSLLENQDDYISISVTEFKALGGLFEGPEFPYDYAIENYNEFVDASVFVDTVVAGSALKYDSVPVKFKVLNVTENRYVDFLFKERSEFKIIDGQLVEIVYRDSLFSYNDNLIILEGPRDGEVSIHNGWKKNKVDLGWIVNTSKDTLKLAPEAGNSYLVHILKPFTAKDKYGTVIKSAEYDKEVAREVGLSNVKVVPNPYIETSLYEKYNPLITGRGQREIHFIHLPPYCNIRIFTITGEHVKTIEHRGNLESDFASWDLKTKDNLDLAYGVYIYHIEAPDIGEKIGKFAVIK